MTLTTTSTARTQHDTKSIAINVATTLLIFLPVPLYMYTDYYKELIGATLMSFVVCFTLPPLGWKRPHPYSDDPNNRPYPRKAE
jgi:hypothetical protein